jgi:hypothetical protein
VKIVRIRGGPIIRIAIAMLVRPYLLVEQLRSLLVHLPRRQEEYRLYGGRFSNAYAVREDLLYFVATITAGVYRLAETSWFALLVDSM